MAVPTQPLTLGIEEEYQIIDPQTLDLRTYISELLTQDQIRAKKLDLKPELMQSQVEVGSHICHNIKEARAEIVRLRRDVLELADENGLMIAAASTHPFARWEDQIITEGTRYKELLDDMQGVARQLLIFGMHVHVGFGDDPESREILINIMNQARYFIPHLLALSTSSPFWRGQNTGLKSYRSVVFQSLPRTGIPHSFISWSDYKDYETMLERVGAFGKLTSGPRSGGTFGRTPSSPRWSSASPTSARMWTTASASRRCSRRSVPSCSSCGVRTWPGGSIATFTLPRTSGVPCATASTAN